MVRHNNIIPNIHCHKKWADSSRGPLHVKLALNQASKKKTRRLARAAKAAKVAPRPLQLLRPVVHCPTQKYSAKVRLGRGFTLEEIKAVGLTPAYARTVGIAVDHRRQNHSEESLNANVSRLNEFKAKLIVFPKRRGVLKAGDASKDVTKAAVQYIGTILPLPQPTPDIVMAEITDDMKESKAYTEMRVARWENKVSGHRVKAQNKKKNDK